MSIKKKINYIKKITKLTSDKFSTYAILYKEADAKTPAKAPVKSPKTGETNAWYYMAMLLGAGMILVSISRKKLTK